MLKIRNLLKFKTNHPIRRDSLVVSVDTTSFKINLTARIHEFGLRDGRQAN